MKRLLAAGSGPIYQICKAFRNGEHGRNHNPEFSMLEWYQPGFNHQDLMQEIDELLQFLLQTPPAKKHSYQALFEETLNIDPHQCELETLYDLAQQAGLNQTQDLDRDTVLQVLLNHYIEPQLGFECPVFLYDFPASQAALAKIRPGHPPVAERFELYMNGAELANGFHELADAREQKQRFEAEQNQRKNQAPEVDPYLIAALESGLPACAGVAIGLDRLVMAASSSTHIREVISFDWERA
jgi:lysyl-tRNA synthetase class 2